MLHEETHLGVVLGHRPRSTRPGQLSCIHSTTSSRPETSKSETASRHNSWPSNAPSSNQNTKEAHIRTTTTKGTERGSSRAKKSRKSEETHCHFPHRIFPSEQSRAQAPFTSESTREKSHESETNAGTRLCCPRPPQKTEPSPSSVDSGITWEKSRVKRAEKTPSPSHHRRVPSSKREKANNHLLLQAGTSPSPPPSMHRGRLQKIQTEKRSQKYFYLTAAQTQSRSYLMNSNPPRRRPRPSSKVHPARPAAPLLLPR